MAASTSEQEYSSSEAEIQRLVERWREENSSSLKQGSLSFHGVTAKINATRYSQCELIFSLSEEYYLPSGGSEIFNITWKRKDVNVSRILTINLENFEQEIFSFFQSILEPQKIPSGFNYSSFVFEKLDTSVSKNVSVIVQKKMIGISIPITSVGFLLNQLEVYDVERASALVEEPFGASPGPSSSSEEQSSEERRVIAWEQSKNVYQGLDTPPEEQNSHSILYFRESKLVCSIWGHPLAQIEPWVELFLSMEEMLFVEDGIEHTRIFWKQNSSNSWTGGRIILEATERKMKDFLSSILQSRGSFYAPLMSKATVVYSEKIMRGMWVLVPKGNLEAFLNHLDIDIGVSNQFSMEAINKALISEWQSSMMRELGVVVDGEHIDSIHQGLYLAPSLPRKEEGDVKLLIAKNEQVVLENTTGRWWIFSDMTWEITSPLDSTAPLRIDSKSLQQEVSDFFTRGLGVKCSFSPEGARVRSDTGIVTTFMAEITIRRGREKEVLDKLRVLAVDIVAPRLKDPVVLESPGSFLKKNHSVNLRRGFGKLSLFDRSLNSEYEGFEPQRGYKEEGWRGLKIYLQFALLEIFDVQRKLFLIYKDHKLSLYRQSNKRTITGYMLQILFGVQDFWNSEWIKDRRLTLQGAQFLLWFVFLGGVFSPLMNTVKFFTELPFKLLAEFFCWLKDSLREGLGQGAYHRLGNWKSLYFVLRAFQLLLSGLHLLVRMVVSPVESAEAAYKAGYTAPWLNEILCLVSIVGSVSAWFALIVGAAPALMALFPQLGSALAPLSHTGLAHFAAPVMNFLTTHLGFVASSALMGVVTATTTFFFFLGLHEVRKMLDMGIKPLFPAEKAGYAELSESAPQFTS